MTDEQIQQNAIAYEQEHESQPLAYRYPFIAGAHSLDEEIEKLKEGKCALRRSLHKRISALVKEIDGLEDELNKLRNPWHSADELPEEDKDSKGFSIDVLCSDGEGCYSVGYCELKRKAWRSMCHVTHWMYIPKGGEK